MHAFHLPDMTCGHCASKVSLTLKRIDPACRVEVDLPRHTVTVTSREDRESLAEALTAAGYPPA